VTLPLWRSGKDGRISTPFNRKPSAMLQTLLVPVAGLMILVAAIKGLLPKAKWRERFYSVFAGGWSGFGVAIYHPVWLGRFAPMGWVHNPNIVMIFGFGLLALGVFGASIMIGER
tara:strand:- start:301 stop:645 length:345 start_codon:yes stop_codon:yes gene_type:complete